MGSLLLLDQDLGLWNLDQRNQEDPGFLTLDPRSSENPPSHLSPPFPPCFRLLPSQFSPPTDHSRSRRRKSRLSSGFLPPASALSSTHCLSPPSLPVQCKMCEASPPSLPSSTIKIQSCRQ